MGGTRCRGTAIVQGDGRRRHVPTHAEDPGGLVAVPGERLLVDIALVLDGQVHFQAVVVHAPRHGKQGLGIVDIATEQVDAVFQHPGTAGVHLKRSNGGDLRF